MGKVFISYARQDAEMVALVERRLRRLDHDVWMDARLKGGQSWWDEILLQIRECDVFLAIVSPASIDSTACTRERAYAAALGRPILPLAIDEMTQALPRDLRQREIVNYARATEDAALSLVAALSALPQAPPLPDPLPDPPDLPLSYLASLLDTAESETPLTRNTQLEILNELRPGLEAADKEERDGAFYVLGLLERRQDLLAESYKEIQRLKAELGPRSGEASDIERAGRLLGAVSDSNDVGVDDAATEAAGGAELSGPARHTGSRAPIDHPESEAPAQPYPQGAPLQPQQPVPPPDARGTGSADLRRPTDRPANNMVWAVLATLFCCLPIGIVAIVNAARVNTLWENGEYERAFATSQAARNWSLAGVVVGVVVYGVSVVMLGSTGGY